MKNQKSKTRDRAAAWLPRISGWFCLSLVVLSGNMQAQEMNSPLVSGSYTSSFTAGPTIIDETDLQENAEKNFLFHSGKPLKTGPGDAANYTGEGKTAVLKSVIVPGWGLYSASQKPLSWINLPVCYGLVGYGVYQMTAGSAKQYQKYMDLRVPEEMDKQFDKSNSTFVTGVGITCAGALLWIRQVVATSAWAKKNEFYRKRAKIWNDNLALTLAPVPMNQSAGLCFSATLKLK